MGPCSVWWFHYCFNRSVQAVWKREKVTYHYVKSGKGGRWVAHSAQEIWDRSDPKVDITCCTPSCCHHVLCMASWQGTAISMCYPNDGNIATCCPTNADHKDVVIGIEPAALRISDSATLALSDDRAASATTAADHKDVVIGIEPAASRMSEPAPLALSDDRAASATTAALQYGSFVAWGAKYGLDENHPERLRRYCRKHSIDRRRL